jgi:hypothetical protein
MQFAGRQAGRTAGTPVPLLPHCREPFIRVRFGNRAAGKSFPPPIRTMPTELFKASRWTKGNFLFPTYIEVSDKAVTRRKRSWFSRDEISVSISKVASVHIKTGVIWSDILIESSGGSDPLASHGHKKSDARRIKELVEGHQAVYAQNPGATD